MSPSIFPGEWARKSAGGLLSALSLVVFLLLDFLDALFCGAYAILDAFIDGEPATCYCVGQEEQELESGNAVGDAESELSETLYGRRNVFRQMGLLGFAGKGRDNKRRGSGRAGDDRVEGNRWSDCGCDSCIAWMKSGYQRLHVVVREPSRGTTAESGEKPAENVIFLHGFICSSSIWTETVFPCLSESARSNYRLFAVDLLGFGKSPKPRDCLYTIKDHKEMIEKSVIQAHELSSFHLVAHSMGCVVAMALAAKYSNSVKSVTLVAPPFLPSSGADASSVALEKFAERRLWPPLQFGSSFMSWYEHLGRCVCFLICRNHRTWEWILRKITRKRDLPYQVVDLTRHTHHSAWHSMHNVICGGAKLMDGYLEAARDSGAKICVFHGDKDQVVPLECSSNVKEKVPHAEVNIVPNFDHGTIILGRSEDFARELERVWALSARQEN